MMKKLFRYFVLVTLALMAVACRLPFFSQAAEPPQVSTEEFLLEEPAQPVELPTATNTARPDPTAAAPEEELPGEVVFSDNGVEITLPDSYVMGDVEQDLALLVEGLKALSEEDAQDIQVLYDQNKDDIMLWGYDFKSPGDHTTSLLIMKNEELSGMSLALMSVFANALLGDEVDLLDQERLSLGGREVLRFLTTAENTGVDTAQVVYLFNEAGKLWVIGFFTNQAQIEQRLPVFDAAVSSFTYLGA